MKTILFAACMLGMSVVGIGCQTEIQEIFSKTSSTVPTKGVSLLNRELNADERERLKHAFPELDLSQIRVIGPATNAYNCIAYSLGITNEWINCPSNEGAFAKLYYDRGYVEATSSGYIIDGYGKGRNNMLHASRRLDGSVWASKLGSEICIAHPENANFSAESA